MFRFDDIEPVVIPQDALAVIEREIATFATAVKNFDYEQLRADSIGDTDEDMRHYASDEAITAIYAMFENTFLFNKNPLIRDYFKKISTWSLAHKETIYKLADALSEFRQRVYLSDVAFFRKKYSEDESMVDYTAPLKSGSDWVMRFQFMIEQKPNSKVDGNYLTIPKNIQLLSQGIGQWVCRFAPHDSLSHKAFTAEFLSRTTKNHDREQFGFHRIGLLAENERDRSPEVHRRAEKKRELRFEADSNSESDSDRATKRLNN